jgi:hypothetical protein
MRNVRMRQLGAHVMMYWGPDTSAGVNQGVAATKIRAAIRVNYLRFKRHSGAGSPALLQHIVNSLIVNSRNSKMNDYTYVLRSVMTVKQYTH